MPRLQKKSNTNLANSDIQVDGIDILKQMSQHFGDSSAKDGVLNISQVDDIERRTVFWNRWRASHCFQVYNMNNVVKQMISLANAEFHKEINEVPPLVKASQMTERSFNLDHFEAND